ncbi:hypothetical protein [Aeribacillus alveayuensis]|uniref:Yip1 domain-containing protein n=1 Tax=Aeribacillus alveayuensis TaxID=279215 RepID=A0ABT9VSU2_9BACI|nr:hypothetical protein [Bacillus alveayuensis]
MEGDKNIQVSKPDDLELNPFIHLANHKPKIAIITRWLVFSVVLCILTVIVANKVPYSFEQLNTGEEGIPDINKFISENPSAQSFLIIVQGISAFFTPIIFIILTTVGLKILTSIFKPIFKEKVSMQNLFLTTTVAYTSLFISSVLRLIFSLIKGEFILYSLGSLPYYTGRNSDNEFFMNFLNSLDLFTIIYCGILAFGLYSYSKAKIKPVFALIFGIYFLLIIGQSLFLPPV